MRVGQPQGQDLHLLEHIRADLERDGFERDWRSHAEGAAGAVLDAHG